MRALPAICLVLLVPLAARAQSDCVPYGPTGVGETVYGDWAAALETDNYSIAVPSDAGGGYVIAALATVAPSRPRMRIIPPAGQGVVAQSAPAVPGDSPYLLEVAFEVAPDTVFAVELAEDAASTSYPAEYEWSWRFLSRVDCFEANDASPSDWPAPAEVSKTVPLNEVHQAFSLAGLQTSVISATEPGNFDWYDFRLAANAEIGIETIGVPADQGLRIRLYDSDGNLLDDELPPVGEGGILGPVSLGPGEYFFSIHPETRGESSVVLSEGESIPDHFDTPYTFAVRTIAPASPPPSIMSNECVRYQPTQAGQTLQGTWEEAFERDNYSFTVPSDPGGGYVTVRIGTDPPSRPHMRIIPPSGFGVVAQSAPSFPGPSPQSLEVAFEVAPGTAFNLEIFEDAVSTVFPVPYTWGWSFVSRVDCFETNNASPADWPAPVSVARGIPLNQELEAYSIAGHQNYAISAFEPQNFDWYAFSLSQPRTIEAATLSVPPDQRIRIRLFDSAGGVLADTVPELGATGAIGPMSLPAGSYYLDLHPEVRGDGNVTLSEGGSVPEHFNIPYRFIVVTRP